MFVDFNVWQNIVVKDNFFSWPKEDVPWCPRYVDHWGCVRLVILFTDKKRIKEFRRNERRNSDGEAISTWNKRILHGVVWCGVV
jgi:hypothetical protein